MHELVGIFILVMYEFFSFCLAMEKFWLWQNLVMVTFWWGIDFLLWDIDFFGCMGIFGHVGFVESQESGSL